MDTERWRKVQELFEAAVELDPDWRTAFLAQECAGDAELWREVEALLRSDAEAGEFLEAAVRDASDLLAQDCEPAALLGRIGKYDVLGRIGQGGFGVVYQGRDPVLGRFVAIKTCSTTDATIRRRFFREAQIAARLQHPNITTVHDLGLQGGVPFLVQEFLAGEDLQRKIDRREPMALAVALDLLLQIARGLEYAHSQGVLHRDIKPANIRVLPGSEVKIMDFGIAKLLHEESGLTSQGVTVGTVGYLAPEQLRGAPVDGRADVFSFGVLAYELLAGRRPFQGTTFSEVSYRLLSEEPPPLRQVASVPESVDLLVAGCLVKDPARRVSGFPQVIAALEPVLAAARSGAPPEMPLPAALPPPPPAPELSGALSARATAPLATWPRRTRGAGRIAGWTVAASLTILGVAGWIASRATPAGGSPSLSLPQSRPAPAPLSRMTKKAVPSPPSSAIPNPAPLRPEHPASEAVSRRPEPGATATAKATPHATRGGAASPPILQAQSREELRGQPPQASVSPADPAAAAAVPASRSEPTPAPPVAGKPTAPSPQPAAPADAAVEEKPRSMVRGDFITAGAGVLPPHLLRRVEPPYPQRALRRRVPARVVLAVLVDENGRVLKTIIKESDDPGLGFNEAARDAATHTVFQPPTRDGIAGRMWAELPFEFRVP